MTKPLLLALLISTLLALTTVVVADEPEIERHVKLKIVADGETLDVELDDLEVGDSQQFFTENGTEFVVTRTEDAYEFDIEGRDEPIVVSTSEHGAYAYNYNTACEGDDCPRHVVIKKDVHIDGEGEGSGRRMIFMSTDGDTHVTEGEGGAMTWIEGDGDGEGLHFIHAGGGEAAAERLLESGALDDLDEAKRQEILDAVRAGDGDGETNVDVKVIKIRKSGEQEDE